MTCKLLGIAVVLLVLAPASRAADDKPTDKDKLQGDWIQVGLERSDGTKFNLPPNTEIRFTFKEDVETITTNGKKEKESKFKLDEKQKHLDMFTGPVVTREMIYSLDGDTLKIGAASKFDGPRPKGFDDKDVDIQVFKRAKNLAAGDKKSDKERLQGTWDMVAIEILGGKKKTDMPKKSPPTLTFAGDKYALLGLGNKEEEGTFKIDETNKQLDLVSDNKLETVYSLDGDSLRIAWSGSLAGNRPNGLDDKNAAVWVFKRSSQASNWTATVELTDKAGKGWLVKEAKSGAKLSSNRDYAISELPKEMAGATYVVRSQEEIKGWLPAGAVKAKKDGTAYVLIMTEYLGKNQFGEEAQAQLAKDGWKPVEGKVATTSPGGEVWGWKAFKKEVKEGAVILPLDNLKWDGKIPVLFVFK